MRLNNIRFINGTGLVNIAVAAGKITAITKENNARVSDNSTDIDFAGAMAFPGLINSHDHLDFNCFALLGEKTYSNYTEWGNHIHKEYKNEINSVLQIPQQLRAAWGMYKNLLSGVTTVINHGDKLPLKNPLITVCQEVQNLHSVKFQKNWRWKLNNPFLTNKTCVIHTGEGVDKPSHDEIDELLQWNLLQRKIIGVHGVAMNEHQAKKFTGLVWCPASNKFLLNRHAPVDQLKNNTRVVFGTDSTLTSQWNIWQHLRMAREQQMVNDEELFNMINSNPARLWNLNTGEILPGRDADIVLAKTNSSKPSLKDFFALDPSMLLMVLHGGNIRLFDKSMLEQVKKTNTDLKSFGRVTINGAIKFVQGDPAALLQRISTYSQYAALPADIVYANKKAVND